MKILVTGSQGAIGRWVVRSLLQAGHTIPTMDQAAPPDNPGDGEHISGDIRNLDLVGGAVQGMEAVVHLPASMNLAPGFEDLLFTVNVQGTWNVLLACAQAGVSRLVNFSSLQALAIPRRCTLPFTCPWTDAVPRQPATAYQISKHVGEELCQAFAAQYGLCSISLRPTFTFQLELHRDLVRKDMPDETRDRLLAKELVFCGRPGCS